MIQWTESQIILAAIGMIGIMSVVPVFIYNAKRNPINK